MNEQPLPPLAPSARMGWAVVRQIVGQLRPASILELGCGGGGFGARLAGMAPRYTGLEPDPTSWRLADERITPRGGTVINGDHTQVPAGEVYDLVCAFEVLEHLADDEAALSDWARLVRPGGHLLLSVPAGPERMGAWDRAVGHFRRYSPEQIGARLTRAGCVRPTVRCYGWPAGVPAGDPAQPHRGARRRAAGQHGRGAYRQLRPAAAARQTAHRRRGEDRDRTLRAAAAARPTAGGRAGRARRAPAVCTGARRAIGPRRSALHFASRIRTGPRSLVRWSPVRLTSGQLVHPTCEELRR